MSKTSISKQSTLHVSIKNADDLISDKIEYFEETGNWRNIIFLPYNTVWKILNAVTIVFNCLTVTYYLAFEAQEVTSFLTLYYISEVVYFITTVLAILHRMMLPYQRTQTYPPRSVLMITIDVISLMPYYEIYYLLLRSSKGKKYNFATDYAKLKVFLRLQTVKDVLVSASNEPGLNHIMIATVTQIFLFSIYTVFVAATWFLLRDREKHTWKKTAVFHIMDKNNTFHWFALSASVIGNVFAHNWSGLITSENTFECFVLCVTMLVGFLNHVMIFFGRLTALYIKKIGYQFEFSYRLSIITSLLEDWGISSQMKKHAIEHYNKFWEKRYGLRKMPPMFWNLPLSMQKEAMVDVYWDALRHSHFFSDIDISFKRALSLGMNCEFFMPGEYLNSNNKMKTKMMYIVTGVVQILSQEDQESPVMSFSGGTMFGEIACLVCVKSVVNLRCATYCEIHTLDIQWLCRTLQNYPAVSKKIHEKLDERIVLAREMQDAALLKLKDRGQKRTSIRWIKKQWRNVSQHTRAAKKLTEDKHKQITAPHISQYLNLYVLSDEVELKVKAICLHSTCPYILEPSSSFRVFCDYIVLGAIIIQSTFLPYIIFFKDGMSIIETGFFYIMDALYLFGLYLEASTAVKTKSRLLSTTHQIIIYKGKQITTLVDIISAFPVEIICCFGDYGPGFQSFMHINRVLKIYKLFRLIHVAQLSVWISYMKIRLIKYSMCFMYLIFFLSCIFYGLSCFIQCSPDGWYKYNIELKNKFLPFNNDSQPAFLTSIIYTTSLVLSVCNNLDFAYSVQDIITEHAIILLGYYLFSYCFAELAACTVLQLKPKRSYQEYLSGLKHFVIRKNVPQELRDLMYSVVDCQWHYNRRYSITGPTSILQNLPENLKNSILIDRIVQSLKQVPLFADCEEEMIWTIASRSKLSILPPSTIIMREETFCPQLYVILRGSCISVSSIPTDKYHGYSTYLSSGDSFPVIELLLKINTFVKVTSITFVEIIEISYWDLMVILKDYSEFYSDLVHVLELHIKEYAIILMRQKGRLPPMVSTQKSYGRGEFFVYETNDEYDNDPAKFSYINPFSQIGKWKFIRHFLLKNTIEPTQTIYTIWEHLRGTVSVMQVTYTLCFMKILMKSTLHMYMEIFFQIIGVIDFYIRGHCRYYNEKGILVTHPLFTARQYLRTSFLLDLFCIFPFSLLHLDGLFGHNYKSHALLVMCLLTRPMLLHRVFNGLTYLQNRTREAKAMLLQNFKYLLLVIVVLGVLAAFLEALTCTYESSAGNYVCPDDSWINKSGFGVVTNVNKLCICFYVVLTVFSTSTAGIFIMHAYHELVYYMCFTLILFFMRWFVLAKITSSLIGGNTMLVQYQNNMKVFLTYVKRHHVDNALVEETVNHYEYIWKRTKGNYTSTILKSFHPVLEADFAQFLYARTLKLAEIFSGVDDSALRHLSVFFTELHIKKDADIIRCNDVHNYLYIVYKGRVDITIASDRLCILTTGGMFGSFHGKTRQTITAKARVHVDLLAIKSQTFNYIIAEYPSIRQRIKRARSVNSEYFMPTTVVTTYAVNDTNPLRSESLMGKFTVFKTFLINPESRWYSAYNYLVNVHLAILSSLLLMTMIVKVGRFSISTLYYGVYVFDFIYFIKIVFGFHLTYIDPDSGLQVTALSKIWRKYVKSIDGFWFDLFTCLPFEVVASLITDNVIVYRFCWTNRIFRFLFMVKYYNNCKYKLTVSKHLRWTYLMYTMLFQIHLMVCLWWIIACQDIGCHFRVGNFYEKNRYMVSNSSIFSFRLAYQYVINVFTATGLRDVAPVNLFELITTIFMISASQCTLLALTGGFASMLVLENFVMALYERNIGNVRKYFQVTDLSMSIINKIWKYYSEMWTRSSGSWIPELIINAPPYLKQDIMYALFGKHLANHVLFRKTHIDFLRQLVVHLKPFLYLPGQYIAEKGDIDGCMYFIIEGEVIVYDKHGNNEIEQVVLGVENSFGEESGLYNVEHDHSYKARFATKIVLLKKQDWEYLLNWFPASEEQIKEEAGKFYKLRHRSF